MNYLFYILIFIPIFSQVDCGRFERYSAKKIDEPRLKELRLKNITEECTIEVKSCTPHEGSRIDGTCNNYKYPSRGSARGPYTRLLKPDYSNKRDHRKGREGQSLPSARKVRTILQSTGRVEDRSTLNVAAVHLLEFISKDVSALNGPLDYLKNRRHCCRPEGESDPRCMPIEVSEDDPYLKVTDIRCLNFSRAETFQDVGCITEIIPPEQINFQTPVIDLSTIYGVNDKTMASVRENKHGRLKMEIRGNRYVPLGNITKDVCFQNEIHESICYNFGFPEVGNFDLRTTTMAIFFMREHNRLAKILRDINPCWKDDRLFKIARQINIATASNIFMYELLPVLLGYRNMVHYGIISERVDHVTAYDEDIVPLVYAEYEIAIRFYHTLLDGRIKKYDENYHYIDELSLSDTLFRTHIIEQNKTFEEINRGTFYQHAAKIDDIQDPEVSENFYGKIERAHDLPASDIQRSRDMGIRGYNDYRHLCGLKAAKRYEDFADVMEIEKIEALRKLYDDLDDIDLLSGIMSENFIEGTFAGPTLFCIIAKQLQVFRYADRFWFERGDQFHSFTLAQLHEIRKTNMARFACDNVEAIKIIQPQALFNVKTGNMPVPCSHIPGPNLEKWRDTSCHRDNNIKYEHQASQENMEYKPKFGPEPIMDYTSLFQILL